VIVLIIEAIRRRRKEELEDTSFQALKINKIA
jgi:hypothetical protein